MHSKLSRRTLLRNLGLLGAAGAIGGVTAATAAANQPQRALVRQAPGYEPFLWSDPRSWSNGRVPTTTDVAVVDRPVIVEGTVRVAGVRITAEGALIFAPNVTTLLESSGNVVVHGSLVMRPADASKIHTLRFINVDESKFVGGGMQVLSTDVGLWVENTGALDIQGTAKTSWTRLAGGAVRNATSISLSAAPIGWLPGDELVVVPTQAPTVGDAFWNGYDRPKIKSVSGSTIELDIPLAHAHPQVNGTWTAEVMNITRNVRIEGTSAGKAHIFIIHAGVQRIRHAALRHLGVSRRNSSGNMEGQGRYGLHFHHCTDKSRGSIVEGVVATNIGSHTFVPHQSNGVTFRDCIAHDTLLDAYWWDPRENTHDTLYERCVASQVRYDPGFRGFRLAGFLLEQGTGNAAIGCVAVGIQGQESAAGFNWPEIAQGTPAVWEFRDCIAHNNRNNGIFTWQNDEQPHIVERFDAYHNGRNGIEHGAYNNTYVYRRIRLFGNNQDGILLHGQSGWGLPMRFEDITIDGAGFGRHGVAVTHHNGSDPVPVRFSRCRVTGHRQHAFAWTSTSGQPSRVDVIDCTWGGNRFWMTTGVPSASVVRVQDGNSAFALRPLGQPGTHVPEWNAMRTTIAPFAT